VKPVICDAKHVLERVPVRFPFANEVPDGVTIDSVVVTAVLKRGTDATPENLLDGLPVVTATHEVYQWVHAGVANAHYLLQALATCSDGRVLMRSLVLPVITFE
jgi:hypothetical protein